MRGRGRLSASMSEPKHKKIFLSSAWKDDQPFVQRLYSDLQRLGYDSWIGQRENAQPRPPVVP